MSRETRVRPFQSSLRVIILLYSSIAFRSSSLSSSQQAHYPTTSRPLSQENRKYEPRPSPSPHPHRLTLPLASNGMGSTPPLRPFLLRHPRHLPHAPRRPPRRAHHTHRPHAVRLVPLCFLPVDSLTLRRDRQPLVTGTSVLGLKYKDGVMLAADNLGEHGRAGRDVKAD